MHWEQGEVSDIPGYLLRILVMAPEHPPHDMAILKMKCWRIGVAVSASADMIAVLCGLSDSMMLWRGSSVFLLARLLDVDFIF